jgi:hypothetical protein
MLEGTPPAKKKNWWGGVEKIKLITVMLVFKNLAPPGILFMPPHQKKIININNITHIISSIIDIL